MIKKLFFWLAVVIFLMIAVAGMIAELEWYFSPLSEFWWKAGIVLSGLLFCFALAQMLGFGKDMANFWKDIRMCRKE